MIRTTALLALVLAWLMPVAAMAQPLQPGAQTASFFSRAEAPIENQNSDAARQKAIDEFLAQAVVQAVTQIWDNLRLADHYSDVQSAILKDPGKYVETYRLFQEQSEGTVFRVLGEVSVDMASLRADLEALDQAIQARSAPAGMPAAAAQEQSGFVPGRATEATDAAEATSRIPASGSAEQAAIEGGDAAGAPVDIPGGVFAAIAEKWDDGQWHLILRDTVDSAMFASSLSHDARDYQWTLVFPAAPTLTMGPSGELSAAEVVTAASRAGCREALFGRAEVRQGVQTGQTQAAPEMEVDLRVMRITPAGELGVVTQKWPMRGETSRDVAMELSALVASDLDKLLRGVVQSAQAAASTPRKTRPEWKVVLRGPNHYQIWEDVVRSLRNGYGALELVSLEMGPEGSVMNLAGVDSGMYSIITQTPMYRGFRVVVASTDDRARTMNLESFPAVQEQPETIPGETGNVQGQPENNQGQTENAQ